MTAMELEACKQELIKEINAADSFDEIRRIAQKLSRSLRPGTVMKVEDDMTPYTRREINSWIDEAEAEAASGKPGKTLEKVHSDMKNKFPWL